ncbi:MAG TPA: DUF2231 domain-containing protein [Candidatus Saccharimonadales bacterium]|nr:DUF2231 domain-containing protein [Candidatus Saccharimonadales bacterium]
MNVHPLLVHYPIAFFMTYAVFELVRFKKIIKQPYWFYVKAILVCLGVVSAFAAGVAGKIIQPQFTQKTLVSIHEHVNESATIVFTIIAFCYIISWIQQTKSNSTLLQSNKFWTVSLKIEHMVLHTPFLYFLVIPGLLLITLGGTLGGIIVYGPNLDPITSFVYSLLLSAGILK